MIQKIIWVSVIFSPFDNRIKKFFFLFFFLENYMYSQPFWYRMCYMNISGMSQRIKYYLAWQIADLVCNASGLGFNGYDRNGKAKWDLCTSVNILQLEVSIFEKYPINNISKTISFMNRKK